MLCGADELGLSDERDGLMELLGYVSPGADFAECCRPMMWLRLI